MKNLNVLDLFSGCGGLSKGFEDAGYFINSAIDYDQSALNTLKHNNPLTKTFCEDLGNINIKKFIDTNNISKINIIIGGPPCQGFSISGKRDIKDPRNGYYRAFFNFVNELRPKVFLLENVPNLIRMGNGAYKDQILQLFQSIGYSAVYKVLLASDYGIPQNRRRVFFIGVRGNKIDFEFPKPLFGTGLSAYITTQDAISDLPENSVNDGTAYTISPQSQYQKNIRTGSIGIYNHQVTMHSEQTIRIISMVPDGGNFKDLPKQFQTIRNVNIAWTRFSSKKPSYTIDTGHRHHFHYIWNRVPTVRESARLQSFPDKFVFLGSKTVQYKHVGNAVPPLLSKLLAKSIFDQLL